MKIFFANFISYVFHPVFLLGNVLVLMVVFEILYLPKEFHYLFISTALLCTTVIPLSVVLLLKSFGVISSIQIPEKKERRIPYLVTIFSYLVFAFLLGRSGYFTNEISKIILSSVFSILILFYFAKKIKISAHLTAIGGLFMAFVLLKSQFNYTINYLIYISILLSGLIGWSRLELKAHTTTEVYLGFLVGVLGQVVGFLYLA